MSRAVLTLAAAAAAAVALTAAPALASTPAPTAPPLASVTAAPGTTRPAAAQPELTDCPWTFHGVNVGTYICQYGTVTIPDFFPNGTYQGFAVGTSHAIWTAWTDPSGGVHRQSLGGYADSGVSVFYQVGWALVIDVTGKDGGTWCDDRGSAPSSGWGGWYACKLL
jgi:hypothetical protein